MKVVLISLFILLYSIVSLGQKTKTELVWKKPISGETINVEYSYDENNIIVDTNIYLRGQNCDYVYLNDFITVYSGSPKMFYKFLSELEKFCSENEAGISMEIMGRTVIRTKVASSEMVKVQGNNKNEYYGCPMKWITKFKSKFVDWCKKNKVAYE